MEKILKTENFFVHFKIEGHTIPISHSIETEKAIQGVIQEISKNIFAEDVIVKVLVLPPEDGGHVKKIIITFALGALGMFGPSVGNGVVMGLGDGRNIEEYTRDGSVSVKLFLNNFLERDNKDLEQAGISYEKFYSAYENKNLFYQSALANESVEAIGFKKEDDFSIKRNQFLYKIARLEGVRKAPGPSDKLHQLIIVTSVNTLEDSSLAWQVRGLNEKKRFSVYMKDKKFNKFFIKEQIYLKTIVARVRYYYEINDFDEIKVAKREIRRVYSYNNIDFQILPSQYNVESVSQKDAIENKSLDYTRKDNLEGKLLDGIVDAFKK